MNQRMHKQFSTVQLKRKLKTIVQKAPVLERGLILSYKVLGRKPWSLGYSAYKDRAIRDVLRHRRDIFNAAALPPRYGSGLDERIVEYPWLFARLKKTEKILLDAGAALNHLEILKLDDLKEKKLFMFTLHPETEHKQHAFVTYQYGDLRKTAFGDGFFDAVICLSTLEHVGMDNTFLYTPDPAKKESARYAFLEAVGEFRRILKKGGTLYLSVPYGRYENRRWFQVFDADMVKRLKETFAPAFTRERYFKYTKAQWNSAERGACEDSSYFDIHREKRADKGRPAAAESVACLELVK